MTIENSSNHPQLPEYLKGWNWGAFLGTWAWGLANGTYIALLVFLPIFNLIMPFALGAMGNEWAWKNRKWESPAHFRSVQKSWALWGSVIFIGQIYFYVFLSRLFVS